MDRLRGKTILIGKDASEGRLCVAVIADGKQNATTIGGVGSVPNSVSRCRPAMGAGHCKIEVGQNGTLVVSNLKAENVTYVNNIEIESKRIDTTDRVTLGSDKYLLDLDLILHTAVKLVDGMASAPTNGAYTIGHLEKVWNEYEEAMEAIQRSQQARGKRRMLPIMIGSASTLIAAISAMTDIGNWSLYITIPIAAISFIIYLINYRERDTSIEDRKRATNTFLDNYVCPNPSCHHFMGNQPYRILKQNRKCPYCGCSFTTE